MKADALFKELNEKKPVNVAQVPQRSPFRYPGGKTWLIPEVRTWLSQFNGKIHLIEPFAGGGIVSLTAAFENLAQKVTMVELDKDVAALWQVIFSDKNKWLADKILSFDLTNEKALECISASNPTLADRGFITLLRNRIYHGGILANGSGFLKYGESGKGIKSRWYPATLYRRITDLGRVQERIDFICGDGFKIISKYKDKKSAAFFIDPPYTVAGRRLYNHFQIDHKKLFDLTAKIKGDFLMTYDDTEEIRALAQGHNFKYASIPMQNTHLQKKFELIISRNLEWFE